MNTIELLDLITLNCFDDAEKSEFKVTLFGIENVQYGRISNETRSLNAIRRVAGLLSNNQELTKVDS